MGIYMKYQNLTPTSEIESQVYFEALDEKINDPTVKNIAIIGPYGSGKSSVIESYIVKRNLKNYLRISLANFCESDKCLGDQEIEDHILQQLFYQLSYKSIPLSGFKKKNHFDLKSQSKIIIQTIFWLFSLVFIPNLIITLNNNLETIANVGIKDFFYNIRWASTLLNISILVVFCWGLFKFLKELFQIIFKGQFKRIMFKSAQIELAEDSTLNKHIDELIYFFEATKKSIVIIEDLDRFNSITLFSKLREVNFLINSSPIVDQAVTFIYAIRDDIFKDNLNRLKFFDFILPIVPIINTTNSGDQLRKMLGRESDPDSNYINDISLYIHDFRLLKNVVNEYQVYRGVINNDNNKKNEQIFSIIIYKNLFPAEFSLEHSEEGLLY
jgi:hypothetical protein